MSYPAISLATATVGRHRCPQKRLQTARQPPVYPNSSPDHRACNSLTPFRCPHPVRPCPSVDSGLRRRSAFPILGLLAVLAAGLLFLLPGGPLQAQSGDAQVDYAENGTGPVETYIGLDPEGRPVYWSILDSIGSPVEQIDGVDLTDEDIADNADFTISSDGVLSFKWSPNFESPDDGGTNNEYKIVVVASDDAPGVTGREMSYHKVTVTVTDVDEDGSISLSAQQPQVSVPLTADLTDQDDTDTTEADTQLQNIKWKWEQASAMNGPWSLISGAGAGDTDASNGYSPAGDTTGKYLRATATYTDKHGDDKTAMAVSAHAVRADPPGENAAPTFTPTTDVNRSVNENSPPGTNVGKPVTAADAPGDILTYTLGDGNDEDSYVIDPATGQISVGPRTTLDTEEGEAGNESDTVEVTATDPAGTPTGTAATVTITIKNVNEAPMMSSGLTKASLTEDFDSDGDLTNDDRELVVSIYAATDQESTEALDECTNVSGGSTCSWSLSGPDAADFSISTTRVLTFKNAPNYESPADANTDNVYMVTVVATDSTSPRLTATRDVVITITNADDAGVITLSSVQPKVRIPFTASLTDEDGGVKDVKWQWYDGTIEEDNITANAIDKATSDTYTPVAGDVDSALGVRATYTDSNGSAKSAMVTEANVVVDNLENAVPAFRAGGEATGKVITADTRSIDENSEAAADIGLPVTATDPNESADKLTYTLGGSDKGSFNIGSTDGQITVKAGTTLNYESKKVYKVTVTATDPSRADATIAITINVTDEDEAPVIAGDDIVKDFKENGKGTVQTFRATDPERRPVYWLLLDDDGDYPDDAVFTISSTGALSFASPPDFEAPSDSDPDNVYKVTVLASDDAPGVGTTINTTNPGRRVTITVTNVSESGSITVDRRYPQVNVPVTATLTDGDATSSDITAATWQWKKGSTDLSDNGADTEAYTPQADDTGTIKVVAGYVAKGADRTEEKSITVRGVPSGANSAPAFLADTAARSVDENKTNTNVGSPVTATDSDDSGKLYYTLNDDTNFSINTSGQLKTKAALNHEDNETLSVTVTATDPSGETDEVVVTVNDVNEAPTIDTGPTRAPSQDENIPISTQVATYAASDVDDDTLVWSLTGTDASDFDIGNQEGGTAGVLTFKEIPDYEKPAASNNVYRVTVTVSDGKLKATRPMTVTVTDVAEDGVVTLSSVQPKVAVELTASLEDSDGGVKDITWQWARSDSEGGTFTNIDGATSATYTPVEGDQTPTPMFLRATASYSDEQAEQTAEKVSDAAVIVNMDNRAPMFPDMETGMRSVDENKAAGDDIGTMVEATDPNGDNLTYTLVGTDAASFDIRRSDGQLGTKAKLDYEIKNTYMVTVTATDPNGLSDSIDVTIMVTGVDEAPEIIVGGLAITGLPAVSYAEKGTGMVAVYRASGRDAGSATWSLSGADAGDFRISTAGVLTFRTTPNYEAPADAGTDNVYQVTVEANDGTNTATKAVTVMVTNVNEDGMVTLSSQAPVVGIALTASLTDADGEITGVKWQWASENTDGTFADIAGAGATSDSYTPADADVGKRLRATASYTDGHDSGKRAMGESANAVSATPTTVVDSYDADGSGTIDRAEVGQAVRDFIGRQIEHDDVVQIIAQYFNDLRSGS